jgi:restriction system protein
MERAAIRSQRQAEKEARAQLRYQAAWTKAAKRDYDAQQRLEAETLSDAAEQRIEALSSLLANSLELPSEINVWTLRRPPSLPFEEELPPQIEDFLPKRPSLVGRLFAGAKHRAKVAAAHDIFMRAVAAHNEKEIQREAAWRQEADEIGDHNGMISEISTGLGCRTPWAVADYFGMAIEQFPIFTDYDTTARAIYSAESLHLAVDCTIPSIEHLPDEISFSYSPRDQKIRGKPINEKRKRQLYADTVAQFALAVLSVIFRAGQTEAVDCVTLNGIRDGVNPATGRRAKNCLFSVRTTRDTFEDIDLSHVDALACLRELKAAVSSSPAELIPVRPILELNMMDPRFIETTDVLSSLESRPNLMDLSPGEFEALITNLFAAMGLETKLTQASRDGGVDCVAYDSRPVLGGKVVIQAKRYTNTVGVSAVRDLFGTVQNEGASKGILVTTSGYGKAAYDFAAGKPLELLDGSNLLFMLAEHAGVEARIAMPDDD